jgi:hypothetical protein
MATRLQAVPPDLCMALASAGSAAQSQLHESKQAEKVKQAMIPLHPFLIRSFLEGLGLFCYPS